MSPGNKQFSSLLRAWHRISSYLSSHGCACFCWDQDSVTGSWFIQPHSSMWLITLFPFLSPEPRLHQFPPLELLWGLAQFSHRAHLKWDCVFWFPWFISSHVSYSESGSIISPVSHGQCLHTLLHPWPTPSELNVLKPACLLLSRFLPVCFTTVASAFTQWLTVWYQKCRCHITARLSGTS